MAKNGRPTKLTKELSEQICETLATTGATPRGAAVAAGISTRTFERWTARALVEPESPYGRFCRDMADAAAKSEVTLARHVAEAAAKDWRAAAWLLERRLPGIYGNRLELVKTLSQMTEDELDAYIAGRLESPPPAEEAGFGGSALDAAASGESETPAVLPPYPDAQAE